MKPSASFKLKEALAESMQSDKTVVTEIVAEQKLNVSARDAFSVQQVSGVLDNYMAEYQSERMIEIALKAHKPNVIGEEILLEVDNKLQMEWLEAIRGGLHNYLKKSLNNGTIDLTFKLFENTEGKEEKKLFTSSDKLTYFCEQNPAVAELRKIFGLELE